MQDKKIPKDMRIISGKICIAVMFLVFGAALVASPLISGARCFSVSDIRHAFSDWAVSRNFSVSGIRFAFTASVLCGASCLVRNALIKSSNKEGAFLKEVYPFTDAAVKVVLAAGIILRVCYMLYTGPGTRTHDVYRDEWGHLDYIRYIADNYMLPPVNICQAYHPPAHHIIAAFVLKISEMFIQDEFISLKLVQSAMAVLNCLTLLIFYKILKLLGCKGAFMLAGTSVFAFHPTNIYFASKINNDNTMMFFYTLSFFYLVKWMIKPDTKNIMLLALSSSLAVLTKKSALMLFVLIAAVFLKELFKNRSDSLKYIKQYSMFSFIAIPLSLLHNIRNYILFNQSFGYVPSFGQGFQPTFFNLLYIPMNNFLKNPFNNGGLEGGEYFLEFLFKSSLFGEWQYPGLEKPAYLLLLLAAANFIIMVACIFRSRKDEIIRFEYLMLLNMAVPFILEAKFRTDFPVACSQDFRYIAPVLISVSYYLGKSAGGIQLQTEAKHFAQRKPAGMSQGQEINTGQLHTRGIAILKHVSIGCIAAFCALSAIFVLALGNYR